MSLFGRKPQHHKPRSPTAWLWWTAFIILLLGGGMAYVLSLDLPDPVAYHGMRRAIAAALLGAGVCIISASAQWWLRR